MEVHGVRPDSSRATAGALLCGILSDTLSLRMSTTSHRDIKAVKFLAPLACEDPEKLGIALLERGMDLSGMSLDALLSRDTKMFTLSEKSPDLAGHGPFVCVEPGEGRCNRGRT